MSWSLQDQREHLFETQCVCAQRLSADLGARGGGAAAEPGAAQQRLRLGLRVEQRGSVRKHVAALQQRLERAAADMQARAPGAA